MYTITRMFGFACLTAVLIGYIRDSGELGWSALFDWEAWLYLVMGTIAFLLLTTNVSHWQAVIQFVLGYRGRSKDIRCDVMAKKTIEFCAAARHGLLASGAVCYLLGLTLVLVKLSDPMSLGIGIATSILPPLYALFVSEMLVVPTAIAAQRTIESMRRDQEDATPIAIPPLDIGVGSLFQSLGYVAVVIAIALPCLILWRSLL